MLIIIILIKRYAYRGGHYLEALIFDSIELNNFNSHLLTRPTVMVFRYYDKYIEFIFLNFSARTQSECFLHIRFYCNKMDKTSLPSHR